MTFLCACPKFCLFCPALLCPALSRPTLPLNTHFAMLTAHHVTYTNLFLRLGVRPMMLAFIWQRTAE